MTRNLRKKNYSKSRIRNKFKENEKLYKKHKNKRVVPRRKYIREQFDTRTTLLQIKVFGNL